MYGSYHSAPELGAGVIFGIVIYLVASVALLIAFIRLCINVKYIANRYRKIDEEEEKKKHLDKDGKPFVSVLDKYKM